MTQQNYPHEQFTFNTGDLAWLVVKYDLVPGIVTKADNLYWSVLWSASIGDSTESRHTQSVAYRYKYENAKEFVSNKKLLKLPRNSSYP